MDSIKELKNTAHDLIDEMIDRFLGEHDVDEDFIAFRVCGVESVNYKNNKKIDKKNKKPIVPALIEYSSEINRQSNTTTIIKCVRYEDILGKKVRKEIEEVRLAELERLKAELKRATSHSEISPKLKEIIDNLETTGSSVENIQKILHMVRTKYNPYSNEERDHDQDINDAIQLIRSHIINKHMRGEILRNEDIQDLEVAAEFEDVPREIILNEIRKYNIRSRGRTESYIELSDNDRETSLVELRRIYGTYQLISEENRPGVISYLQNRHEIITVPIANQLIDLFNEQASHRQSTDLEETYASIDRIVMDVCIVGNIEHIRQISDRERNVIEDRVSDEGISRQIYDQRIAAIEAIVAENRRMEDELEEVDNTDLRETNQDQHLSVDEVVRLATDRVPETSSERIIRQAQQQADEETDDEIEEAQHDDTSVEVFEMQENEEQQRLAREQEAVTREMLIEDEIIDDQTIRIDET